MTSRAQAEEAKDWEHPERLDQIGQRFAQIVGGDHPAEVHLELMRRGHNVRSFDNSICEPPDRTKMQQRLGSFRLSFQRLR